MNFRALTCRLRRLASGRAPGPRPRPRSGGRRLTTAIAGGAGLSAMILLLAAAWWLTDLQAAGQGSGGDRGAVVIDMPPSGVSTGSSDTSDNTGVQKAARGDVAASPTAPRPIMTPAPQPALVEQGPYGPLPKIAPDGRKPWQVYARPSDPGDTRPRIAIVITEIGLSTAASLEAIRRLPAEITLSVDPYAAEPDTWAPKARDAGHEILLSLPMESAEFPFRDPGPSALLTSLAVNENIDRLHRVLSRCTGYVGVASAFGRRFEQDDGSLRPILEFIGRRGLMYVGGVTSTTALAPELANEMEFPRIAVDVWIDEEATAHGIDRALAELEATARDRAVAVGLARNYPLTVARLARWAASLEERDIALVPVSAVAGRQFLP
jgi:uncharacterized protein